MSNNVDLNRLRDTILSNQNSNNERPTEQRNKILVDREGRIHEGTKTSLRENGLSEVPQETFADRKAREKKAVSNFMPVNTKKITTDEGVAGWLYNFTTEFDDAYIMFAYYDGNFYQVIVVEPQVEEKWRSPHTGHVYSDARICFGEEYDSGRPTLQEAYSKSVLWANGLSVAMRTDFFPFSANQ